MVLKQSTIEEIIESERDLVLTADQRYGDFSRHARECSIFLSRCIISVDRDRMMFARFFSLLKKHHMLALLSALRLHKVQTMINLRQVLEAGINAGQVPLAAGGAGGEAGGGRRLGQMTALIAPA